MKIFKTSESVSYGHPDKLADWISEQLLYEYTLNDENVKTGIEIMLVDKIAIIGGEINTNSDKILNIEEIVKNVIKEAGYNKENYYDPNSIKIINLIGKQSPEINKAVVKDNDIKSGDQGIMIGYAINDTSNYMPLDLYIAKLLINNVIKLNGLGPDAKSQITIVEENKEKYIDTILISTMHSKDITLNDLRNTLKSNVILWLENNNLSQYLKNETKWLLNPSMEWYLGGPQADTGLTGRKIVVDQYGGNSVCGGGNLNGKDFSKLDRSGTYAARYIAKNLVAANIFEECKVQLSYAIGIAEPVSIRVFGKKDKYSNYEIDLNEKEIEIIKTIFPLTPNQICNKFDLKHFKYYQTGKNGHFGIDSYPWEQLDKVEELKNLF